MSEDADFFRQLERELGFDELPPGTVVEYTGPMVGCHGLWVVRVQIGDERYTLAHPLNEWQRLNASREHIVRADA